MNAEKMVPRHLRRDTCAAKLAPRQLRRLSLDKLGFRRKFIFFRGASLVSKIQKKRFKLLNLRRKYRGANVMVPKK